MNSEPSIKQDKQETLGKANVQSIYNHHCTVVRNDPQIILDLHRNKSKRTRVIELASIL